MMNKRAALSLLLGVFLASLWTTSSSSLSDVEDVYSVTTKLIDDVKESTFTIKLRTRLRTTDILECSLYDPKYEIVYHKTPCENASLCDDVKHLTADGSYVGNFEVKYRGPFVERLMVGSGTSLKQLSFYRIVADHLFLGVDDLSKVGGTFPMFEQSVYGKCEALVKIVRNLGFIGSGPQGSKELPYRMASVKKTRNLETCHPVPALLIFDDFFYHPMMASVYYDIKSSISRTITSNNKTFTSYTTEDIAVRNLERGGNTTMLHVRTTVTLLSSGPPKDPYPRIIDPVSVKLPFIDGIDPAERSNGNNGKKRFAFVTRPPVPENVSESSEKKKVE